MGWFAPLDGLAEKGLIVIVRNYYREPADVPTRDRNPGTPKDVPTVDLREELFTLAHEYGHFRSYTEGHHNSEYSKALTALEGAARPLSESTCEIIWNEEKRAWDHARALLIDNDITQLDDFEKRVAMSLSEYKKRFIDPPTEMDATTSHDDEAC